MLLKKNKTEFLNCNLAGFEHYDGYAILPQMKVGDELFMVREDENKYDSNAIALFYKPKNMPECADVITISAKEQDIEVIHVGYIPAACNNQLAKLMDFGHGNIFECRISGIDNDAHPNQQVRIRINLLRQK